MPSIAHASTFPTPTGGASLLLSWRLQRRRFIVVGGNTLAASRAYAALESDAEVTVLYEGGTACEELRWRAIHGQLHLVDNCAQVEGGLEGTLESLLRDNNDNSLVCITDTVLGSEPSQRRTLGSAEALSAICHQHRIPVNVTDYPDLCDFTFTSTHRFADPATGSPSALQVGVTTNGQGCRLAARVRREIVARLPRDVGGAAAQISALRALAKATESPAADAEDEANEDNGVPTPNRPVPQRAPSETPVERARRQMKYVAQVSEYWPFSQLAALAPAAMASVIHGGMDTAAPRALDSLSAHSAVRPPLHHASDTELGSLHALGLPAPKRQGRILLVGSGPGHPALLTLATHAALTRHADLVLSDKLVPAAVLALIPPHVEVRIARKFPGNAEGAQTEMMEAAVEAAQRGLTVVRVRTLFFELRGAVD